MKFIFGFKLPLPDFEFEYQVVVPSHQQILTPFLILHGKRMSLLQQSNLRPFVCGQAFGRIKSPSRQISHRLPQQYQNRSKRSLKRHAEVRMARVLYATCQDVPYDPLIVLLQFFLVKWYYLDC